jgi:transposase
MISVSPKHRILLAIEPIDFRKGIEGISTLCKYTFQQDPMTGHYFVFSNKRKTAIKILYYDAQGFCLFQKRLSSGRFNDWPTASSSLVLLNPAQLHVLLYNGDPQSIRTAPSWQSVLDT